jgi:hypothetical protein
MAGLLVVAVVPEVNSTKSKSGRRTGSTSMVNDNALSSAVRADTISAPRTVYLLWHTDLHGDEKLIGVYAARPEADLAIGRLGGKPGFAEGGEFEIAEYNLNEDHWIDGFVRNEGLSLPTWLRTNRP